MKIFTTWVTSLLFFVLGIQVPSSQVNAPTEIENSSSAEHLWQKISKIERSTTTTVPAIIFTHGDVSWLPELATKAGWPKETHKRLAQVILRESGGCPNRRGGDMVDKDCNITGVSEWNHRSDTSLMQLNGINYDPTRNKFAPICLEMGICTQEPLLDPLTNLKAGKLLFDYWQKAAGNGWIPWDSCNRTGTCGKP